MADTTIVEGPDTPAHIFAARAFKSLFFGSKPPADATINNPAPEPEAAKPAPKQQSQTLPKNPSRSPVKPNGILLTPGTATARRKRVSFGKDLFNNDAPASNPPSTAKVPTPWKPDDDPDAPNPRPRTKLTEALEASRSFKPKSNESNSLFGKTSAPVAAPAPAPAADLNDPAWEDDDFDRDPDITIDLNEPRSQSGRYWKAEWKKYQEGAKEEMTKLVRYKVLAKQYAKMKDDEASAMAVKLKEAQDKLEAMEKKLAESTQQPAKKRAAAEEVVKTIDPRTEKVLADTREELKKAREQIVELKKLKTELREAKSAAKAAESRELRLQKETKRLEARKLELETEARRLSYELEVAKQKQEEAEEECRKLRARTTAASTRVKPNDRLTQKESIEQLPLREAIEQLSQRTPRRSARTSAAPIHATTALEERPISSSSEDAGVDLLKERFARLGDQPQQSDVAVAPQDAVADISTWTTANTTLPAGRAAAALARLQQKREERRLRERVGKTDVQSQPQKDRRRREGADVAGRAEWKSRRGVMKENVRPMD